MATWRDHAAPIVAETIFEVTGKRRGPYTDAERTAVRKALRSRYPFGERNYWPYKVWLKEIRFQLEGQRAPRHARAEMNGQQRLF